MIEITNEVEKETKVGKIVVVGGGDNYLGPLTKAMIETLIKKGSVDPALVLDEDSEKAEYAHASIEGKTICFIHELGEESLMECYPQQLVLQNDQHLIDLFTSAEMIEEIKFKKEISKSEPFRLDFSRQKIRNQVMNNKPKHLVKKVIR